MRVGDHIRFDEMEGLTPLGLELGEKNRKPRSNARTWTEWSVEFGPADLAGEYDASDVVSTTDAFHTA